MPRVSDEHRQARREQILDAALKCFSKNGFHQTGITEVVRRSGLSHGAVYLYFKSKDDLIEALAGDRHRREAVLNSIALRPSDPVEALRKMIRLYADWLVAADGAARRRVEVNSWSEALRNKRIRASVVEGVEQARRIIVPLIEAAQHKRVLDPKIDAETTARTFVAVFQGFVLQETRGERIDADACVATLDRMLIGLRPMPQPKKVCTQRARQRTGAK